MDFIKIKTNKQKNFQTPQNSIKKVKRQPKEWENIFESHISGKRLISRIYKELLYNSITYNPIQKMGKKI